MSLVSLQSSSCVCFIAYGQTVTYFSSCFSRPDRNGVSRFLAHTARVNLRVAMMTRRRVANGGRLRKRVECKSRRTLASNPRSYRHVVFGGRRDGDGNDVPRRVRVHRRLVHLANRSRGRGRGVVRSRITHVRSRAQRRQVRLETHSAGRSRPVVQDTRRVSRRARVCFHAARTRRRGTRPSRRSRSGARPEPGFRSFRVC